MVPAGNKAMDIVYCGVYIPDSCSVTDVIIEGCLLALIWPAAADGLELCYLYGVANYHTSTELES